VTTHPIYANQSGSSPKLEESADMPLLGGDCVKNTQANSAAGDHEEFTNQISEMPT
jgi:hypothetical protein